jgi:hypothetical protein
MLHKLAIWFLLPPLLLNGLWMVCNPSAAGSAEESKPSADCIRICAALEAELGKICFVLPGAAKSSITVIDFGPATLPSEIALDPAATGEQLAAELPPAYGNPSLSNPTPPPRG